MREYEHKYYNEHKEQIREYSSKYSKKYYNEHKEQIRAQQHQYYREHNELFKLLNKEQRESKNYILNLSDEEFIQVVRRFYKEMS